MTIRLKGEDLAAGLVDWVKSEIKEAPKQAYELGKFFFTVSIGTVGALATIEKLNSEAKMDSLMIASLLLLLISILVALDLARPRKAKISGSTDLLEHYNAIVEKARGRLGVWFGFWLAGVIFGALAVAE